MFLVHLVQESDGVIGHPDFHRQHKYKGKVKVSLSIVARGLGGGGVRFLQVIVIP